MRSALPNAAFPFCQSIADGATVPLFYENRIPELLQTIARANRRFPGKEVGLIVDYVGVFRKLQEALALYGGAAIGEKGDTPIQDKTELVEYLKHLIAQTVAYLTGRGIDTEAIKQAQGFAKIALVVDAVDNLLETDETKRTFLGMARGVSRVYRAILPDPVAAQVAPDAVLISVIGQKIKNQTPAPDISHVIQQVEDLLDRSVAPVPYVIPEEPEEPLVDLSQIDFEKLKEKFAKGRQRTEAEKLRALLNQKLEAMVARNHSRADFLERFQKLIDAYNAGSLNIQAFFAELVKLTQDLSEEEPRAIREGLTEEELALFDILTKPEPDLTEKQKAEVKKVCKALLETLKGERLVLDWRNKQQARAAVRQAIEVVLDKGLPDVYEESLYQAKCESTFNHVFMSYDGGGESVYTRA